MEMTQLGHFVTTAKQESITKAASMLNITQPTLSISISRLEDELGVNLFDRTGNKIRLNDTGRLFLSYVEQALDLLRYGVEQACANDGILTSLVAFSIPDSGLITEAWGEYVDQHPDVVFHQHSLSAEQARMSILDATLDFAFSYLPIRDSNVECRAVTETSVSLYVLPTHPLAGKPVTVSDLRRENFIVHKGNKDMVDCFAAYCQENAFFPPRVAYAGDNPVLFDRFMQRGDCVLVLPMPSIVPEQTPYPIVPLDVTDWDFTLPIWQSYHKSKARTKAGNDFCQYLYERLHT